MWRPHLYLTEEHSIRWKFCLVNQKLFIQFGPLPFGPIEDEIQHSKIKETQLHVAVYRNVLKNIFDNV